MAVQIPLTKGLFALVDDADLHLVSGHKWHAYRRRKDSTTYAARSITPLNGIRTKVFMHRVILENTVCVDHRDGNGLNNTRDNLRTATHAENSRNVKKPSHGVTSQYKGMSYNAHAKKFQATVRCHGKNIYLGLFVDEKEGAYAYDREARARFSFFARTNFPLPPMVLPSARLQEAQA